MLSTDTRFFGDENETGYLFTFLSAAFFMAFFGCHSQGFTIKPPGSWYAL